MARSRAKGLQQATDHVLVGVLCALIVVVPAALWGTADPVGVPKWTVLLVGSIALSATVVLGHLRTGQTAVYAARSLSLVAAFLAAATAATVGASSSWLAIVGEYTYYQGLITFVALSTVLVTVLLLRKDPTQTVLGAMTVSAGVVGVLTAGQFLNIEWFGYEPRMYGRVVTTLGNSNFGAAFLALTLPAILHHAFFGSRSDLERWSSAAVGALVAVHVMAIGSVQGPITALVAVIAWLVLVGLVRVGVRRTVQALAGCAVVGGVVAAAAWSRIYVEVADSVQIGRQGAWMSAWEQFRANPVRGVGLEHFGQNYTTYRPAFSAARESERFSGAGQAHNVVLDLLADGGLLLGGTYLALVLYTGYRAARGLRRLHIDGHEARYLQLAAVSAVWLGYQTQAQVSIDHVPLALMHWVGMGLILRLADTAENRPPLLIGERLRRAGLGAPALLATGAVCAVLLWFSFIPFRADLAAGATEALDRRGRPAEAIEKLEQATSLVPFRSYYWMQLGLRVQRLHGAVQAAPYIERGARLDGSNSRAARMMARYHVAADNADLARKWYAEAVRRDQHNPEILEEAAAFHERDGDEARAASLRRRLRMLPPPPRG